MSLPIITEIQDVPVLRISSAEPTSNISFTLEGCTGEFDMDAILDDLLGEAEPSLTLEQVVAPATSVEQRITCQTSEVAIISDDEDSDPPQGNSVMESSQPSKGILRGLLQGEVSTKQTFLKSTAAEKQHQVGELEQGLVLPNTVSALQIEAATQRRDVKSLEVSLHCNRRIYKESEMRVKAERQELANLDSQIRNLQTRRLQLKRNLKKSELSTQESKLCLQDIETQYRCKQKKLTTLRTAVLGWFEG